jgi:hypothetical protein
MTANILGILWATFTLTHVRRRSVKYTNTKCFLLFIPSPPLPPSFLLFVAAALPDHFFYTKIHGISLIICPLSSSFPLALLLSAASWKFVISRPPPLPLTLCFLSQSCRLKVTEGLPLPCSCQCRCHLYYLFCTCLLTSSLFSLTFSESASTSLCVNSKQLHREDASVSVLSKTNQQPQK